MQKYDLTDHAPSFLPEGKKWRLVWHDEFDGDTLDETKWNFRLNFWGKPFPAFSKEGVELDGHSNLHLNLVKRADGSFCSPHLQTASLTYDIPKDTPPRKMWPFGKFQQPKFLHRFGFYEVRCRLPKNDGWHSAFWLQAPGVGSHPNPRYAGVEVDIMENYSLYTKNKIVGGPIWGGYGNDNRRSGHFQWDHVETPDKWHYYAVEWTPDSYTFFIDGKEVGKISPDPKQVAPILDAEGKPCGGTLLGPISHVEQFILLSTECHGYRYGDRAEPILEAATLPDYFEVDHVRVFDDDDLGKGFADRFEFDTGLNTKVDEMDLFKTQK